METDSNGVRLVSMHGRDPSKCRHFNGTSNGRCEAGVKYESVNVQHEPIRYRNLRPGGKPEPTVYTISGSLPCADRFNLGGHATCPSYSPLTAEEIAERDAADKRSMDLLRQGLSSCCEAPIDESRVIREGRHKGHGPRYCGKCGRCVFVV